MKLLITEVYFKYYFLNKKQPTCIRSLKGLTKEIFICDGQDAGSTQYYLHKSFNQLL